MDFKDYYATLGVARDAGEDEIKRAYRKLARKFHPDVSKEADAEAHFKEVAEAYEVLKDPEKRAAYDNAGDRWNQAGAGNEPPPDWNTGYEFGSRDFGSGDLGGDHSDFFEALFGRRGGPRARRPREAAGDDHHARVAIDLEDAYRGATRSISLRMPAPGEDGRMRMQQRTIELRIPKGIREGQQLRLAGQGGAAFGDAPAGDLYLEVSFHPHPLYSVAGSDVTMTLPVAPWEAALGADVKVPTPDGEVTLSIPRGSKAGRKLRLRGKGLPSATPGDLYVVLSIALPPSGTPTVDEAYRVLERSAAGFDPRAELKGK
jgi:curved DNA-binding protein